MEFLADLSSYFLSCWLENGYGCSLSYVDHVYPGYSSTIHLFYLGPRVSYLNLHFAVNKHRFLSKGLHFWAWIDFTIWFFRLPLWVFKCWLPYLPCLFSVFTTSFPPPSSLIPSSLPLFVWQSRQIAIFPIVLNLLTQSQWDGQLIDRFGFGDAWFSEQLL